MGVQVVREEVLAELPTGRGRSLRVRFVEYRGTGVRLDIRAFFVDEHGQSLPSPKGVGIKPEHIDELRRAIDAFEAATRKR